MTVQERRVTPISYEPHDAWDEAFDATGEARPLYASLLARLADRDLGALAAEVAEHAAGEGATFGGDRAFPIDPIPRLIAADEWQELEDGLGQRVRALDAFVSDLARERRAVGADVVPERLVATLPFLEPDLAELPDPVSARICIAGLDVVRDIEGRFHVLEDNVRTPSGMAYLLATRRAVKAHLGYDEPRRPVRAALANLLGSVLAAAQPDHDSDAAIVVLSDGPDNSAYFEHRVLADLAGVPLVHPQDLRVEGSRLIARASGHPIQVVYRRTNEDRLRAPDGSLTAMGELLLDPLRDGTLSVVNGFGTGVADDKRIYPYVDALIRFYLDEEPILPSVVTYDLANPAARAEALERLDELVLKPRDGHGGLGVLIGPEATADELREAAEAVRKDPEDWSVQEVVRLSTHPTVVDGRLVPRHVDIRPFLFYDGRTTAALPGGLTRVALDEGNLVVNSSRGGGGKDTWVLP
jgi:carboxylate-amine ligase